LQFLHQRSQSDRFALFLLPSREGQDLLGERPCPAPGFLDLQQADAEVVELLNDFDASYSFIENVGTTFYFHTDLKAPRYRVIASDVMKPAKEN
jgi:hypothetical protein